MIETLQTLTCNGAGDGTVDKRDEHIAAFLENLKKEQQASHSLTQYRHEKGCVNHGSLWLQGASSRNFFGYCRMMS